MALLLLVHNVHFSLCPMLLCMLNFILRSSIFIRFHLKNAAVFITITYVVYFFENRLLKELLLTSID